MKRINVILKVENGFELDYNYKYPILVELYNVMSKVDERFSKEIHDSNKISLFNFNVYFSNANYCKNIKVKEGFINLTISGKKEIVEKMVKGIMINGFNLCGNVLKIMDIKEEKKRFKNICLYNVRTPIVVRSGGKFVNIYEDYDKFISNLGRNLLKKYKMVYGKEYKGELYFDVENVFEVKKKIINNVKGGKLVGFSGFNLYIQADTDMQKIAFNYGVGEKNSLGCGNLKLVMSFNE